MALASTAMTLAYGTAIVTATRCGGGGGRTGGVSCGLGGCDEGDVLRQGGEVVWLRHREGDEDGCGELGG